MKGVNVSRDGGGKAICLKEFNEGKYSGGRRGGKGKPVYMEN